MVMADTLKLALAQLNPTVGAIRANAALVRDARDKAAAEGANLLITGELVLCGYPPEDLVYRPAFLDMIESELQALAALTADGGPALLVGAPWRQSGALYNAALVLDGGVIQDVILKHHLPNYGVFDEVRVFSAGPLPQPVTVRGVRMGVMVCEDMWFPDVSRSLACNGAELLVVLNGSPWELDKIAERQQHAAARVGETGLALVYVNQVGGQDELVFDGSSFVLGCDAAVCHAAPPWDEGVTFCTWSRRDARWWPDGGASSSAAYPRREEYIYRALVLGLRDYVSKNGFPGVLLGLSGGIDSALSAAIAVDALGADRVWCVMMPSVYTSRDSLDDAAEVARLLGCRLDTIPIAPAVEAWDRMLAPLFSGHPPDITEENLQSRTRGVILMGLSNKFGPMVLSTGNKSEMSTGYATLYGDMCGGYSVLKDIYKTTVFAVSEWRNSCCPQGLLGPAGPVMPRRVIDKPPTAELRHDQKDEDSLPPYPVLDSILEKLIEERKSVSAVAAETGYPQAEVERVWALLNRAEYKRRQAPPGVKITRCAFGRERRYPLTNAFVKLA